MSSPFFLKYDTNIPSDSTAFFQINKIIHNTTPLGDETDWEGSIIRNN